MMETFYQIMGIAAAIFLVYVLWQTIKNKPQLFTKESLSKSFLTMGLLGLGLMVFIGFLVFFLNHS